MAVAGYKPGKSNVRPVVGKVENPQHSTVLIDHSDVNLNSLMPHIQGSPLNVTYFHQSVNMDDGIAVHDFTVPDSIQQYTQVNDLILRVSTPLDPKGSPQTGVAIYYLTQLPPNVGDVFLVKLPGNRQGLFVVVEARRLTYNQQSVFELEYSLSNILIPNSPQHVSLLNKVTKIYYFDNSNVSSRSNPLLTDGDYKVKSNLYVLYKEMIDYYFKIMVDYETHLLLIPGQQINKRKIYDPYIVKFIFTILNRNDSPLIANVKMTNVSDKFIKQYTVLDAILKRDIELLDITNRSMSLTSARMLSRDPVLRPILYQGVTHIVYPYTPDTTTGWYPAPKTSMVDILPDDTVSFTPEFLGDEPIVDDVVDDIPITDVVYPRVLEDNYYIFTENFYRNRECTQLEGLVLDYMQHKDGDIYLLMSVIKDYKKWSRIEQFYYIPILLLLIKHSIKKTHSIL